MVSLGGDKLIPHPQLCSFRDLNTRAFFLASQPPSNRFPSFPETLHSPPQLLITTAYHLVIQRMPPTTESSQPLLVDTHWVVPRGAPIPHRSPVRWRWRRFGGGRSWLRVWRPRVLGPGRLGRGWFAARGGALFALCFRFLTSS